MVHMITGGMNTGKSTRFLKLYNEQIKDHLCDGFYTEKIFEGDTLIGFDLIHLRNGEARTLARREPMAFMIKPIELGHYYFARETFYWANLALARMDVDRYFIDEVGLIEVGGEGFHRSLKAIMSKDRELYMTVRDTFVDAVLSTYRGLDIIREI